ncbi:MAG: esterase family protein, partial [Candidatus Mariimomonas ferrooxydans]
MLLFLCVNLFGYFEDGEHFSETFKQPRKFRVFLPDDYKKNSDQRYPVIYYCHGMSGRYAWDAYDQDSLGRYRFNGEFLDFSSAHQAIIVNVDGYLGLPSKKLREEIPMGTRPYYDEMTHQGGKFIKNIEKGKGFRFTLYIRELVAHIDRTYRTKDSPQHRGISGLSMGGHAAIFIGSSNPHISTLPQPS